MKNPSKEISNDKNIEVNIRILPFNSRFIKLGGKSIEPYKVEKAEHYLYKEPLTTGRNLIVINKESKNYGIPKTTL
ncbi:MAG: hypothetical protein A7316_05010 [Candidatus Altiarchaeales archaeon WOR_SM1_86-2]|nr:MAG: hypothetical protein A7315_13690 [Candidatus Altiarchaeales archaeon WOR_SM1_79]ODS39648.1 MAG: hypothetical protein A7316_05010 [Candidatus Altiarchaeales archaeon WOR_SM1_86-2]